MYGYIRRIDDGMILAAKFAGGVPIKVIEIAHVSTWTRGVDASTLAWPSAQAYSGFEYMEWGS